MAIRPIARIFPALRSVPQSLKSTAEEIRIKCGTPLIIRSGDQNHVIQATADSALINECISAICQNSVHTYEKDIANGFITLYGGHRAGICGSAVYNDDGLHTIKNVSSVNIRIARQHCGSAKDLLTLLMIITQARDCLLSEDRSAERLPYCGICAGVSADGSGYRL